MWKTVFSPEKSMIYAGSKPVDAHAFVSVDELG